MPTDPQKSSPSSTASSDHTPKSAGRSCGAPPDISIPITDDTKVWMRDGRVILDRIEVLESLKAPCRGE